MSIKGVNVWPLTGHQQILSGYSVRVLSAIAGMGIHRHKIGTILFQVRVTIVNRAADKANCPNHSPNFESRFLNPDSHQRHLKSIERS